MKIVASFSVASIVALLVGCSATPSNLESSSLGNSPASVGNSDTYCDSICSKQHECDSSADKETCTNQCKNKIASVVEHVRGDSLNRVAACVNDSSCKKVLDGDAEDDCGDEELASLSPSDKAKEFCSAWKTSAKKCGETVDTASCLKTVKIYNDASLDDAKDCTDKSCSSQAKCIRAAFGGGVAVSTESTSSSSGSGTSTSGKKKTGGSSTDGTDDTSEEPTDEGTTNPGTCAAVTGTSQCDQCLATNCCSEITALQASAYYSSYQACLSKNGSAAETYCANQYSSIKYYVDAVNSCRSFDCDSSCP